MITELSLVMLPVTFILITGLRINIFAHIQLEVLTLLEFRMEENALYVTLVVCEVWVCSWSTTLCIRRLVWFAPCH